MVCCGFTSEFEAIILRGDNRLVSLLLRGPNKDDVLSLYAELRRRNVFKVALVYAAVAWLLLQVSDTLGPALHLPDWFVSAVAYLVILGFPIAIILAWAFELTPEGLRSETKPDSTSPLRKKASNSNKLNNLVIGALVLSLGYFVFDKLMLDSSHDESETVAMDEVAKTARSIAVLPFVNMSSDEEQEFFSDGLSEELLNLLVKIPELRVAARTSSFSFKGKDTKISQIGAELNVTHVLEGSVRKAGDAIRVTAQLIKVDDGFHLWSETYDRNLDDIFVVQDEIAAAVVRGLKITLLGELPEQQSTDAEVYSLYLQGKYFVGLGGRENSRKSVEALKQALAIDPEYAPAWSSLSSSYARLEGFGGIPFDEGVRLSMHAVNKALELDDQLASAWAHLAWMRRTVFWDWQGAKDAIEKALQLEPNNAFVITTAASITSSFGEYDNAIKLYERNFESNPLSVVALLGLGIRYNLVGRHDEARTLFERSLALNPEYPRARARIADTYLHEGRPEEALAKLAGLPNGSEVQRINAAALFDMGETQKAQMALDDFLESPLRDGPLPAALLYAWRGEYDAAFEWLEMAYDERSPDLSFILSNPVLPRFRDDPRFPMFIEKIGLRQAWEAMPAKYGGPSQ